jgi:hypothetical protein
MSKYRVVFDTNQVMSTKPPLYLPFNTNIAQFKDFCVENNIEDIEVCLPEIVIRERIQHRIENIAEHISRANEAIEPLQSIGHKTKKIKKLKNYQCKLNKSVSEFIKKYSLHRIPVPSVNTSFLLDRAIRKVKPFYDNSSGFKDTLIYLSILEDARGAGAAEVYIFCTADKGFTQDVADSFEVESGKKLYICSGIEQAKEKLDELIPLNRHLEERNNKIKNLILKNIGSITAEINKAAFKEGDSFFEGRLGNPFWKSGVVPPIYMSSKNNIDDIAGYNFKDIIFSEFNELTGLLYNVKVIVDTEIIYRIPGTKQKESEFSLTSGSFYSEELVESPVFHSVLTSSISGRDYFWPKSTHKRFTVTIRCDLGADIIKIKVAI